LLDNIGHDLSLVVLFCLPLLYGDGPFRTVTETRAKAIAHQVAHQPRLVVDDLNGPFRAVGDAQAAACAFFLVYGDDVAFHEGLQVSGLRCFSLFPEINIVYEWVLIIDVGQEMRIL
jgi:hypothetical protein